jgi:predicted HicB family RNase H-like nuclease
MPVTSEERALEIHQWVHEQMQHQEYTNTQLNISLKLPKLDYARLVEACKKSNQSINSYLSNLIHQATLS